MGTYEHVTALHAIDIPMLNMVRALKRVEASSIGGDFIDGLIVSLDLIHKRTDKKKYLKRIMLVTDAGSEITATDDIQTIIDQMKTMDVTLSIMYVSFVVRFKVLISWFQFTV